MWQKVMREILNQWKKYNSIRNSEGNNKGRYKKDTYCVSWKILDAMNSQWMRWIGLNRLCLGFQNYARPFEELKIFVCLIKKN